VTNWYDIVFELIDMRSFSNLWYWIALAVMWSSTSHWVLGVPWDMVTRARRYKNPIDVSDLEDMLRINCNRIERITGKFGLVLVAMAFFILTMLFLLGFVYKNEFSQAVFLMAFPMSIIVLLSVKAAKVLKSKPLQGDALYKKFYTLRLYFQMIGMFSIFVTAMWGMLQNLTSYAFYSF
jgi:hypothetical protein